MGDEFIRDARTSARSGWGECIVCGEREGFRILCDEGWIHPLCIEPKIKKEIA